MTGRIPTLAMLSLAFLATGGCSQRGDHTHMEIASTPPAVIEEFHRDFPGLALSHVDRIVTYFDHATEYEVKFRDADNNYHRRHYTTEGKLLDGTKDVVLVPTTRPAK